MKLHNLICVALSTVFAGCASQSVVQEPSEAGPKISILGDSYSTFEGSIPKGNAIFYRKPPKAFHGVEKPEDCWWGLVAAKLGGTIERNESWSGSSICYSGYSRSEAAARASFVTRDGRLGDPDIILICGGTNDSWAGCPIGDYRYANWTPEELKAFRPAMAKMLADIAVGYPKAKVWFILNTGLSKAINDSVHQICRHYGVNCIDLKKFDRQKGHPTAQGMREIAEQVTAEIQKL